MSQRINHIAPLQVPPSLTGLSDKPLVVGASLFYSMKIIEDLGMMYASHKSKTKRHYAVYECPLCGKHFKAQPINIKNGNTSSCGCIRFKYREIGVTSKSHIYIIWCGMRGRCYHKYCGSYEVYGGKGITVCDEWKNDFICFYKWSMSNGYKDGLEIDRINGQEGYSPKNCRWVTRQQNAQSRRKLSNNTSGYIGVQKYLKKWVAQIYINGSSRFIGSFNSAEEAAMAYDNICKEHRGEFAVLNFPNI